MKPREDIPQSLVEKIERELEPREKVRWMERPARRIIYALTSSFVHVGVLGMSFCLAFLTLSTIVPTEKDIEAELACTGCLMVPFFALFTWMLFSPIWRFRTITNTIYAISDRRAIVIEGGWSTTIRSFPAENIRNIDRKEHWDGTGDVLIDRREYRDSDGYKRTEELGFRRVRDAKEVEAMLKKLASEHQAERGRESFSPPIA